MKTELKDTVIESLTVSNAQQTVKVSYVTERKIPCGLTTVRMSCEDVQVEVEFHTGPLAGCRFRNESTAMDHEGAIFIGEYSVKGRMWRVKVYTWGDGELEQIARFYTLKRERILERDAERLRQIRKLDEEFAKVYVAVDCEEPVEDVDKAVTKLTKQALS